MMTHNDVLRDNNQHNDSHHNVNLHNDSYLNGNLHKDNQHDIQHNESQNNNIHQ